MRSGPATPSTDPAHLAGSAPATIGGILPPAMPTDPPRPACTRDDATAVVRRLRDVGHTAYFAGGCVRDLLLGLTPKDYDVATDAPPQRVRQLFHNTQAVGAAFGVILVRLGPSVIEVATFRTDGAYTDGRRPDTVTFATAEEDAKRRDFTINGLFMDPLDGDQIIDFVGGRADLDAKVIRAIGNPDERFAEDHLRLLRAVRFAARLGFTIEEVTAEAIRRHAAELPRISPERVGDELRRMLFGIVGVITATSLLYHLDLMLELFRFFPAGDRGPLRLADHHQPRGHHSIFSFDEFNLTGLTHAKSFGMALATVGLYWRWNQAGRPNRLGSLLTKPEVANLVRGFRLALKISNDEAAEIEGILLGLGAMLVDPEPTLAARKRFLATPAAEEAIWLLCGVLRANLYDGRLLPLEQSLRKMSGAYVAPPPLVTGDDLTAAGATPGPAFKRALDAAYDAQLEDRVTDRAAALALALDMVRR